MGGFFPSNQNFQQFQQNQQPPIQHQPLAPLPPAYHLYQLEQQLARIQQEIRYCAGFPHDQQAQHRLGMLQGEEQSIKNQIYLLQAQVGQAQVNPNLWPEPQQQFNGLGQPQGQFLPQQFQHQIQQAPPQHIQLRPPQHLPQFMGKQMKPIQVNPVPAFINEKFSFLKDWENIDINNPDNIELFHTVLYQASLGEIGFSGLGNRGTCPFH